MLMFVILAVSSGAKEKGLMAGIAVGGVIGLEALFAGPICGASMNPARSLAPAVVSGNLAGLWIYLAAPLLGSAIGVACCRVVHPPGCCTAKTGEDSYSCGHVRPELRAAEARATKIGQSDGCCLSSQTAGYFAMSFSSFRPAP